MINKVESSLKLDLEDEVHRGEPVRAAGDTDSFQNWVSWPAELSGLVL